MIYKTLLVMIAVISLMLPLPSTTDELHDPECPFCEQAIDPADSVTVTYWQTNEKYPDEPCTSRHW